MTIDDRTRTELEAAAFRTLVEHLRARTDVQNIDLMNSRASAATAWPSGTRRPPQSKGLDLTYEGAREVVYGMPYADWKAQHQTEATAEQKAQWTAGAHSH